jgi:hypothetical protein
MERISYSLGSSLYCTIYFKEINMIALHIVILIALFVYSLHLKDIYYGYGRAVALIYTGKAVPSYYEDGSLKFTFPDGSQEMYLCGIGRSVTKMLRKGGTITDIHFDDEGEIPTLYEVYTKNS